MIITLTVGTLDYMIKFGEVLFGVLTLSVTFSTFVVGVHLVSWSLCMNLVWILTGSRLECWGLVILTPKCMTQLENN